MTAAWWCKVKRGAHNSGRRALASAVGIGTVAGLLAACGGGAPGADSTVNQYLSAWNHQDYRSMALLVAKPPSDFVSFNRSVANDLRLTAATHDAGAVSTTGSSATAAITSHLLLGTIGSLTVHSRLRLSESSGAWKLV